jgi:hypothetical protein
MRAGLAGVPLIAIDCKLIRVGFRFSGIRYPAHRRVQLSDLQLTAICNMRGSIFE